MEWIEGRWRGSLLWRWEGRWVDLDVVRVRHIGLLHEDVVDWGTEEEWEELKREVREWGWLVQVTEGGERDVMRWD